MGSIQTSILCSSQFEKDARTTKNILCHNSIASIDTARIQLFDDISDVIHQPTNEHNIFFHETSCQSSSAPVGLVDLNARQACAVESAARAHPNRSVFLLFSRPVGFERNRKPPPLFEALASYENIRWLNLNLSTYAAETPVAEWLHPTAADSPLFHSDYFVEHTADLLRLVSLYRWGGMYMDLDFVVRRRLDDAVAAPNFCGEELNGTIANGLLQLSRYCVGHMIAARALRRFAQRFRGDGWSSNGATLLAHVLRRVCNGSDLMECRVFSVLRRDELYAVHYGIWWVLFEPRLAAEVMELVRESRAVHFWNRLSGGKAVVVGSGSAYELLAKEFCPKVYGVVVHRDGGVF